MGNRLKSKRPLRQVIRAGLIRPVIEFMHSQAMGGIVLIAATLIALVLANSGFATTYFGWRDMPAGFSIGSFRLEKPVLLWINDGLMAVFFLLVGLEIKREFLIGELSNAKLAMLPIAAAIGGMAVPAAIYAAFNWGQPSLPGWGIPMATDIAFALGILALLGSRVPLALKIFLTAFAIVDDLGAVLIIALFYTAHLDLPTLGISCVLLAALIVLNVSGVRPLWPYLAIGALLWLAILKSGVHATVAGVLIALTIPTKVRLDARGFAENVQGLIDRFRSQESAGKGDIISDDRISLLQGIEDACEDAQMPLQRLEHALHGWVNFLIVPIFAFANAGVAFGNLGGDALRSPITLGIALGLVLGKPIGVMLSAWFVCKVGLASMPRGVTWNQMTGAAVLGGVGFTMSLFIASLAFEAPQAIDTSKVGIFLGSLIAAVAGVAILLRARSAPASS